MTEPQNSNQLNKPAAGVDSMSESPAAEHHPATQELAPAGNITLRRIRAEAEIHAISRALEQTGWNRKRAAELLSISYRGLLEKIRQHNITSETGSQLPRFARAAKLE